MSTLWKTTVIFASFGFGTATIRLETERYERIPAELRSCPFCIDEVETEFHVKLNDDLRELMFEKKTRIY